MLLFYFIFILKDIHARPLKESVNARVCVCCLLIQARDGVSNGTIAKAKHIWPLLK